MKTAMTLILVFAVFISAVYVVNTQHTSREVFMEIEQLKKGRDQLNEEWGRLQLEQSTWAVNDRIEQMAGDKLAMFEPDNESLVYLIP